jgi:hypothetical protein
MQRTCAAPAQISESAGTLAGPVVGTATRLVLVLDTNVLLMPAGLKLLTKLKV